MLLTALYNVAINFFWINCHNYNNKHSKFFIIYKNISTNNSNHYKIIKL